MMKRLTLISIFLIVGGSVIQIGCGGATEVPIVKSAPLTSTEVPSEKPDRIPKIWRDFSKSENEGEIKETVPELIAGIRRNLPSVDGIEVVRFSTKDSPIWSEGTEKFFWGPPPVVKPFVPPDLKDAPIGAKLYQNDKDEYIANARAAYESEKARIIGDYNTHVDRELDRLQRYLLQVPTTGAPCTKFASLKLRLEEENRSKNLVITDGWADCDNQIRVATPTTFTGRVTILLVTRQLDVQADETAFGQRKEYMHQMFPNADVVPSFVPGRAIDSFLR
jgi:hypothetical protein